MYEQPTRETWGYLTQLQQLFGAVDMRVTDHGWWAIIPSQNLSSGWCPTINHAIHRLYEKANRP